MENEITLTFFPRAIGNLDDGLMTIYCRIKVNNIPAEFSTKQKITTLEWNSKRSSKHLQEVQTQLSHIRNKIAKIQKDFEIEDRFYTSADIKFHFKNETRAKRTLLTIFKEHNDWIKSLVDLKKHSKGSYYRYLRTYNHIEAFIKFKYGLSDMTLNKIDLEFILSLERYLIQHKTGGRNTITKYLTNLNKIMRDALAKKWIKSNPFDFWKATREKINREFLTKEEVKTIYDKEISIDRLSNIRDVFVFCCYTGLAYCDAEELRVNDITTGIDGKKWIYTNRLKTNNRCAIPLLSLAQQLFNTYSDGKTLNEKLFPLPSNQKTNAYLKEIATICEIQKNLTFHMARHTFATTVTLTNGVPIATVSKMLGHSSIKTTQIYARVVDLKISNDMLDLESRLSGLTANT